MKQLIFLFSLLFSSTILFAQQDWYKWRIGLHGGYYTYYGDLNTNIFAAQNALLSPSDNIDKLAYGLSVERNFSKTWGLKFLASQGTFQANDRAIDWQGNDLERASNYARSLNAETYINDVAAMLTFHFDNDWLLKSDARIAPYINVGVGLTQFEVFGDLFQENGDRYHYWLSDNTIRNAPDGSSNALILEQDGVFETNLSATKVEGNDYPERVLHLPIGVGLKIRLGDKWNLNIEALAKVTNTDYLDDVSGTYRTDLNDAVLDYISNPTATTNTWRGNQNDNLKDIYGSLSLSLHYNFGFKKENFTSPEFYVKDVANISNEEIVPVTEVKEEKKVEIVESNSSVEVVKEETEVITTSKQEAIITETQEESSKEATEKEIEVVQDTLKNVEVTTQEIVETVKTNEVDTVKKETLTTVKLPSADSVKIAIDSLEQEVIVKEETTITKIDTAIQRVVVVEDTLNSISDSSIVARDSWWNLDSMQVVWEETTILDTTLIESAADSIVKLVEELVETAADTIKEIDNSSLVGTNSPSLDIQPLETKEQQTLLEVRETRLQAIRITDYLNSAIVNDSISIENIDQNGMIATLDSLKKQLNYFQEYESSVAVQANENYTAPTNDTIWQNIDLLSKELEQAKQTIQRLQENRAYSQIEVEKIKAQQLELIRQKMELEYAMQKEQLKEKKRVERKAERAIRKAERTEKRKDRPSIFWTPEPEKSTQDTILITKIDTLVQAPTVIVKEGPVVEKVIEKVVKDTVFVEINTPIAAAAPVEVRNVDAELIALAKEMEASFNQKLAQKETIITDLELKVNSLEDKLKKIKVENTTYQKALQAKIDALNGKIAVMKQDAAQKRVIPPVSTSPSIYEIVKTFELTNVYFDKGKVNVKEEFQARLDKLSYLMTKYPELNVVITGYTDKSGSPELNFKLSRQRAQAVKQYLVRQSIQGDRIDITYFGDAKSTAVNDPFARRVEVRLFGF